MTYLPKQGDIIWVDFDPSKGREIKKKRPAVVLSSDLYNEKLKFVIVSPITSTLREESIYFSLEGYKVKGQVVTAQIYSFDVLPKANRRVEFADKLRPEDFLIISQMLGNYFDFAGYRG